MDEANTNLSATLKVVRERAVEGVGRNIADTVAYRLTFHQKAEDRMIEIKMACWHLGDKEL